MKRYKYIIANILWAVTLLISGGCASEQINNGFEQTANSCPIIFDAKLQGFDAQVSRSGQFDWADNSTVYLLFINGDSRIDGRAVYNKVEDLWTLYYNGTIPSGTTQSCYAYYFDNLEESDVAGNKIFNYSIPVYSDMEGSYSKSSQGFRVSVSLIPATGRIRFKGESGMNIKVSGLETFKGFNPVNGKLLTESINVPLKVDENGFTPYVYSLFPAGSRSMKLAYDSYSFTTDCDEDVLKKGESGYMAIPTVNQHNGWNMKEISLPTLDKVSVTDIGKSRASLSSRLLANGNGTVSDCGFCYSTSPNPTVADMKISYGVTDGKFGKTINDLTENTTYYVRAYAINEIGVGYSEEVSFKTLEVTIPVLSAVTIGVVSNTSFEAKANVTSKGNGTLTDAGFVYSTEAYPTVESGKISCGKVESLNATISNLQPETKYYIRAYASNEKGVAYGEEKTVTTAKNQVNPYTVIDIETSYGYYKLNMASVAGGKFKMGAQSKNSSNANYDKDAYSDEDPVHNVTLNSFLMGSTVVTQKLWYVVMGNYPALTSANGLGDEYPVYNVSYTQCQQFISKLNKLTGKKFRLPTEAEWEYAARGGVNDSGFKYSGGSTIGKVAWYDANSSGKLHEVAKKEANELQIYDMSGNIWEWCSDWYGNYSIKDQSSTTGPATGTLRVIRGGCFSDIAADCRVSVRSKVAENSTLPSIGFRLVME